MSKITPAEIKAIFTDLYGNNTAIIASRQLKGGVFNTTYFVKTNRDQNGSVLRVAPADQRHLFEFEKSMMSAEPHFYRLLHEKGIPTSKLITHDRSRQLLNREYIIFEFIPSVPMNDDSVPQEAKPSLYRQLGELIASLHEIKYERFGWYRANGRLPMHTSWSSFLYSFAQEIADKSAQHAIFSTRDLTHFLDTFAKTAIFDQLTQPRMIHADLWEGNVLVRQKNNRWAVAALIDVDKAIFGDPAFEFAAPAIQHDAFWQGYGLHKIDAPAATFRQTAYRLLSNFMYAYIWYAQFENMERYERLKKEALETLALINIQRRKLP